MQATIAAIYEDGVLKLEHPLPLPDRAQVNVIIRPGTESLIEAERTAWLEASEQALMRTWDNASDDVFNDLLPERSSPPTNPVR